MKKVIYIVKSDLHIYPPCLAQIRMLKKAGVDVAVWFGSCNKRVCDIFKAEQIPYVCLGDKRGKYKGKLDVINNWLNFRKVVLRSIYENRKNDPDTVYWFGTAESVMPLVGSLRNIHYALTSLELLDDNKTKNFLFSKVTDNAKFIVACEETRAYFMRYMYGLEELPYIMPNKPYEMTISRNCPPSIPETQAAIEMIRGKKFIIYQGVVKSRDYMLMLANALKEQDTDYYFVLMGLDPENIFPDIKREYDKSLFIENIPAPYHLEVTSYARIGFLFYDGDSSLNRAFCAPNKIYEYSGLGIPQLANDVPGLKNTVGRYGVGECVSLSVENLKAAIQKIDASYAICADNSRKLYEDTDNQKVMAQIIHKHLT